MDFVSPKTRVCIVWIVCIKTCAREWRGKDFFFFFFFRASCQRETVRRDLFSISRGKKLTYGIISVSHKALKGRLIKGALFLGGGKEGRCTWRFNSWHHVPPPPRFTFQGCSSQEALRLDKRRVERTREGGRGSFQRWINTTRSRLSWIICDALPVKRWRVVEMHWGYWPGSRVNNGARYFTLICPIRSSIYI